MVKDEMTPRDHPDMNFRLKPESKMSHYMALLLQQRAGWLLQTYTSHNRY